MSLAPYVAGGPGQLGVCQDVDLIRAWLGGVRLDTPLVPKAVAESAAVLLCSGAGSYH